MTMKATALTTFDGARDGDLYPTRFRPGDLIEGNLAEIAVRENWAREIEPEPAEEHRQPRRRQASR
jgi:hypothetical protein